MKGPIPARAGEPTDRQLLRREFDCRGLSPPARGSLVDCRVRDGGYRSGLSPPARGSRRRKRLWRCRHPPRGLSPPARGSQHWIAGHGQRLPSSGLSPPARGSHRWHLRQPHSPRDRPIPARAGEPGRAIPYGCKPLEPGLSPPARGSLGVRVRCRQLRVTGPIPARAGEPTSIAVRDDRPDRRAYPRPRGGASLYRVLAARKHSRAYPRPRGGAMPASSSSRDVSAAGLSPPARGSRRASCGPPRGYLYPGLSPPARGSQDADTDRRACRTGGPIPARAGEPNRPRHLRELAIRMGLSPPARGSQLRCVDGTPSERTWAYPRPRGGAPVLARISNASMSQMAYPRPRGGAIIHYSRLREARKTGPIPARAGEPT